MLVVYSMHLSWNDYLFNYNLTMDIMLHLPMAAMIPPERLEDVLWPTAGVGPILVVVLSVKTNYILYIVYINCIQPDSNIVYWL